MTKPLQENVEVIKKLDIKNCPKGKVSRFYLHIVTDGMGLPIYIPLLVARGNEDGVVLGITAAVHGNELNGLSVIQRLFNDFDIDSLKGTIIAVPVVNTPGFHLMQRKFNDGRDLNRLMPGRADGDTSQVYGHRLVDRLFYQLDYLLDLHTASFGRVNSYYIRANMYDDITCELAHLQNPKIILNSPAPDSTVRGALSEMFGVKAITLEVGDPNKFQKGLVRSGLEGIHNTLIHLEMLEGEIEPPDEEPIICEESYWIYTDLGGVLQVHPSVTDRVKKGEPIATLRNIFGDPLRIYTAPEDGVVIGKSVHPVAQTGARILHLGIEMEG
jgi:predicted deacylase